MPVNDSRTVAVRPMAYPVDGFLAAGGNASPQKKSPASACGARACSLHALVMPYTAFNAGTGNKPDFRPIIPQKRSGITRRGETAIDKAEQMFYNAVLAGKGVIHANPYLPGAL